MDDFLSDETLFDFPCDFPLKVMGRADTTLAETVITIVQKHAPDFVAADLSSRVSSKGNYLSLNCKIRATSLAQLNDLYHELVACPLVKVVL